MTVFVIRSWILVEGGGLLSWDAKLAIGLIGVGSWRGMYQRYLGSGREQGLQHEELAGHVVPSLPFSDDVLSLLGWPW